MNVLIIYTHPNHDSLNFSLLQSAIKGLTNNDSIKKFQVLDLYEEGFNPALYFDGSYRRRDMHKTIEFENHRRQITEADKIVFIYPIWWGRPPAMLLGYFDQILATNFAYKSKGIFLEGLLKNKSAVCISTMKGPSNYPFFFLNNAHKALMKKGVLNTVGIKPVKFFEFGNVEKKEGKQTSYLNKIESYFTNIK